MSKSARITRRRLFAVLLCLFAAFVAYDFISYRQRERNVYAELTDFGGHPAGSLGGWPLGKERRIVIERPLSDDELVRLSALLDRLPSRDGPLVAFRCDLTPHQLESAKRALEPYNIFHVDPED